MDTEKLRLFVYGSLKRNEFNWHVIESGVEQVTAARLRGRMFLRPDGYPAMMLSSQHRLGGLDYARDLALAWESLKSSPGDTGEPWISGQLLLVRAGCQWQPRLDEFEGFFPGAASEYLRVLAPVEIAGQWQPAWTYTAAARPPAHWPAIEMWTGTMVGPLSPYQHGLGCP